MSAYRPIDCDLHDLYEIAVLRRQRLAVRWRDEQGRLREDVVAPTDVETTAEGEFLVATDSCGSRLRIRLDRIVGTRDSASGETFPPG